MARINKKQNAVGGSGTGRGMGRMQKKPHIISLLYYSHKIFEEVVGDSELMDYFAGS